jgi:hypothetical protein
MRGNKVDNNQILKYFPSRFQQFVLEDLKWFKNKVLIQEAEERRSIVEERVEKGEEICWRTDRRRLGPTFYGMQYRSFERIWKSVSEEKEGVGICCFI